ncbi:DUF547 domain-containing protein [Neolewinella lacunae]|uniref:DUF547 domain-containing protein n=1 Tax=Neolewinella lacunae TaxID=1517758 RepID=A0A923PMX6_9BACT|nr:DUF547 domain-containing protein [Neolewinella lacunae]MBC6993472.1 DUF547 domain-containing protein [Neolewinella lacunae]MDN3636252.1 DUF547 domain-containing protein [Neolewinella lacunae]
MLFLRFFAVLVLAICLFTCQGPNPPDSVVDSSTPGSSVENMPGDTPEIVTAQDQIADTRNDDPSTVAPEKLPAPVAKTAAKTGQAPSPAIQETAGSKSPKAEEKPTPAPSTPAPSSTLPPSGGRGGAPASSAPESTAPPAPMSPEIPSHAPWNTLLQAHVSDAGVVNYAALKKQESQLDAYLASLAANAPTSEWPRKAAMAYWINAYNAYTVKLILKNYPVQKITDLDGGDPWKVKWITLDGKSYSLNNIEHDILRPKYQDARIHFAVNCAAKSCPPLPNQAFTADNLESMLQANARKFIRNGQYNQTSGEQIMVSKIFDWYQEDFGDLRSYLNKYLASPLPEGTDIRFKDYDWSLNGK